MPPNYHETRTREARIYCGLNTQHEPAMPGEIITRRSKAHQVVQKFCQHRGGVGVISDVSFCNPVGSERGIMVLLSNTPRAIRTWQQIRELSLDLAQMLREQLHQQRVYVVVGGDTILVGEL